MPDATGRTPAGDPTRDPTRDPATRVLVLADDLIWAERLAGAVRAAGARPIRTGSEARLEEVLGASATPAEAALVDLAARTFDGIALTGRLAEAGIPVLAIGQHDDVGLRKRALAAGARRVLAYRKLAEDGPAVVSAFLSAHVTVPA